MIRTLAVVEDDGLLLFLPAQHRWEVMAPNPLEERLYCRVIVRDRFNLQRVWMGASGRLLLAATCVQANW